ncbi:hypothetical protein NDU88_005400 [Pleurodeles waltl]|uniref:Uncharacterized protein n=1 Tax=Pleurodeles waltl TaxID=8319 RepID=A0AAV7TVE4_PLEWA|nr:hypothetical protein NDU88_005400 [Pleurodeles waltl]
MTTMASTTKMKAYPVLHKSETDRLDKEEVVKQRQDQAKSNTDSQVMDARASRRESGEAAARMLEESIPPTSMENTELNLKTQCDTNQEIPFSAISSAKSQDWSLSVQPEICKTLFQTILMEIKKLKQQHTRKMEILS